MKTEPKPELGIEERLRNIESRVVEICERRDRIRFPVPNLKLKTFQALDAAGEYDIETLKHWHRTDREFRKCTIKKGRRINVDLDALDRWFERDRVGGPQYVDPPRPFPRRV